jgi:hypothetical protein
MIHPSTELRHISDVIGYGVFATELIPEGTITYIKDSLEIVISEKNFKNHNSQVQEIIEKYCYVDEKGDKILSWDFAKYVNHCCNFNTISTGYGFEIAVRDIYPGEEITDEYGIFNLDAEMFLYCKEKNCRGILKPSDFDNNYEKWDKMILKSLPKFFELDQPLLPFMDPKTKKDLELFHNDPRSYKSVYNLRYQKSKSIKPTQSVSVLNNREE